MQNFEKVLNEMLDGRIDVRDIVSKDELEAMMTQKHYAGFSLAPSVKESLLSSLEDDYGIDLAKLEQMLSD